MVKNRTKIDIIVQILNAATGGETRTRIMYKSYLSHAQAKGYLDILIKDSLIASTSAHRYITTEKGLRFIEAYEHLGELLVQEVSAQ
jgi:predicted transcriptional regulator